jgi:hypothetical protein
METTILTPITVATSDVAKPRHASVTGQTTGAATPLTGQSVQLSDRLCPMAFDVPAASAAGAELSVVAANLNGLTSLPSLGMRPPFAGGTSARGDAWRTTLAASAASGTRMTASSERQSLKQGTYASHAARFAVRPWSQPV